MSRVRRLQSLKFQLTLIDARIKSYASMEISNFEADILETQAELGKMLMIFVISISKLTEMARSGEEVRGAYSDRLLVS